MNKGAELHLEIEGLAYGGMGVAKPDGFVVFVKDAVPGDRVRARVIKKTRDHAEAVIEALEVPSPLRIEPPCPIFATCGGCTWQNLTYEEQLRWKRKQLLETLVHLGGLKAQPEVPPMVASPRIWAYRNKMEFSFGADAEGRTILGFHAPGSFARVFEVERCLIHPEPFDALLSALTAYAREHDLPPRDPRSRQGFLRHAVLRHSEATGRVVLALITTSGALPAAEALHERLRAVCPALQGFVWGLNDRVSDVAAIEREAMRFGDLTLEERLNGLVFHISPQSFFQTNTGAAAALYRRVVALADLSGQETVLDAYCGGGAIGLHCAGRARAVVGVDLERQAIWDARANARANGVGNATFLAAPMSDGLALAQRAARRSFSRVIIDPPRGGMDKRSLAMLIDLKAPVFVYVSCNPSTLARDLRTLIAAGYTLDAIETVDMFPHTYHIEAVARLRLTS